MDIGYLCSILEIKEESDEKINSELANKLGLLTHHFRNSITKPAIVPKYSYDFHKFEYLKEKGFVKFDGERNNNMFYKLTNKGLEAYETFEEFSNLIVN